MNAKDAYKCTIANQLKPRDWTNDYIREIDKGIESRVQDGYFYYTWLRTLWVEEKNKIILNKICEHFKSRGYFCKVIEKEQPSSIDTMEVLELTIDWKESN